MKILAHTTCKGSITTTPCNIIQNSLRTVFLSDEIFRHRFWRRGGDLGELLSGEWRLVAPDVVVDLPVEVMVCIGNT